MQNFRRINHFTLVYAYTLNCYTYGVFVHSDVLQNVPVKYKLKSFE